MLFVYHALAVKQFLSMIEYISFWIELCILLTTLASTIYPVNNTNILRFEFGEVDFGALAISCPLKYFEFNSS